VYGTLIDRTAVIVCPNERATRAPIALRGRRQRRLGDCRGRRGRAAGDLSPGR
jgi:hypothetical protein